MTTPLARRLLGTYFGEDTFTMEINNKFTPGLDDAVKAGWIQRHPGGPFGSNCSYYRTEAGMAEWNRLYRKDGTDAVPIE